MTLPCPRCGEDINLGIPTRAALSRTDNKTDICSTCGIREAHEAWQEKRVMPQTEWLNRKEQHDVE